MKNNKNTILIIVVLILLGIIACYMIKNITEKPVEEFENNKKEENVVEPVQMNDEYKKVYDTLVTNNKQFGFYYTKDVNIDTISDDDMIELSLTNYLLDNNIKIASNSLCFSDEDLNFTDKPAYDDMKEECTEITKIKKSDLDKYIKDRYNTSRIFNSTMGDLAYAEAYMYMYNDKTQEYYVGQANKSGGSGEVARVITKLEKDNDNLYIYDKAMYCEMSFGATRCLKTSNVDDGTLFDIAEEDLDKGKKELIITTKYEDGEEYEEFSFDYDYIFKNYETISYKHTFKNENGKYYWINSEVLSK